MTTRSDSPMGPVVSSGILIGIGMGGFVDGIVLHQILQWHNMLSTVVPPTDLVSAKVNMLWDGLFHAMTWLVVAIGIARLWRAGSRHPLRGLGRAFAASLAIGWGAFNLVEGLLDHQIIGIHHVHPGEGEFAWDMGFLGVSALMLALSFGALSREVRAQRASA